MLLICVLGGCVDKPAKTQKLLLGDSRVLVIQKPADKKDANSFNDTIADAFILKSTKVYDIKASKITKPFLLSLWSSGYSKTERTASAKLSRFRQICAQMSGLEEGLIYIYNAHSMSGTSVQLLSQLIRHVEQYNLAWRFILVVDAKHKHFVRLNALSVYEYYPPIIDPNHDRATAIAHGAVSSPADTGQVTEGLGVKFGLIAVSLVFLVSVGIFAFVNRQSATSVAPLVYIDDQSSVAPNLANPDNKASWDNELLDYLEELEAKNLDFEQKLHSLKSQATSKPLVEEVLHSSNAKQEQTFTDAKPKVNNAVKPRVVSAEYKPPRVEKRKPVNKVLDARVVNAITVGDLPTTESLLANGVSFEGRGRNGESALIMSVVAKQNAVVDVLLSNNLDTELVDNNGRTALYYAAIDGNLVLVQKLLDAGANVNALTNLDKTPLMAAIHNGHSQTAKLLVTKGADVNVQDHSGWSSLFYAVWNGENELASLLKAAGARTDLRDRDGYSLAQISKMKFKTN